jgi:hypothetical protein
MFSNYQTPGVQPTRETYEASVLWQTFIAGQAKWATNPVISSTAVDATNTPTTVLRPGLVMAKLDSSGEWVPYDPDATDGSQQARGILVIEVDMMNYLSGSAEDKYVNAIVTGGRAIAANLLLLDYQARSQLIGSGFVFDDVENAAAYMPFRRVQAKAADYTVTVADNETMFTTAGAGGAINFTLPAIEAGLRYQFLNVVDQNMTVTSPTADNIVGMNELSADTAAFSTAGEKIGGLMEVTAIYVGATLKWIVRNLSAGANTITVAG